MCFAFSPARVASNTGPPVMLVARQAVQVLAKQRGELAARKVAVLEQAEVFGPALAEALGCPLLTRDRRLARASSHGARVELV